MEFGTTITAGIWHGTAIESGYGGTGFSTYAKGDLIYASATNTLAKLAVGADGKGLILSSGLPVWSSVLLGDGSIPLTANWNAGAFSITANSVILGSAANAIAGGATSGGNFSIFSTTHSTKGKILFGTSAYDEVNNRLGIGTTSPITPLHILNTASQLRLAYDTANYTNFAVGSAGGLIITNSSSDATGLLALSGTGNGQGNGPLLSITNTDTNHVTFGFNLAGLNLKAGNGAVFCQFGASYSLVGTTGVFANDGFYITTRTNHPIILGTGSTWSEKMRIDNSGRVGIGTTSPNTSALLDLSSTTLGLLLPRMTTTQRDAISSPASGLIIYNTSTGKINFRAASAWEAVTSS